MMRYFLLLLLFGIGFKSFSQQYITENGGVEFISKAPLNEFSGVSKNLNGLVDLDKNLIDFYLDLNTLETGIGLRDRHMRENYLETERYPFAEFTGTLLGLPNLDLGQEEDVKVKGVFKLHGIEKEMDISGKLLLKTENDLVLEASFEVFLGDFEIAIPKLVFYELAEKQLVVIKANLTKQ